jgi:hypothetical protein
VFQKIITLFFANIFREFSTKFAMALMVYSGACGKQIHKKPEVKNLVALSLYFKTFKKMVDVVLGKDSRSTKFVFTQHKNASAMCKNLFTSSIWKVQYYG